MRGWLLELSRAFIGLMPHREDLDSRHNALVVKGIAPFQRVHGAYRYVGRERLLAVAPFSSLRNARVVIKRYCPTQART